MAGGRALFRADAAMRYCQLWDSELYAGAALRLAGFSSGTSVGARGGWAVGRAISIAAFGGERSPVDTFPVRCLAVEVRLSLRFYCGVWRWDHACCLTHSAKQDGLRYAAFLFREGQDRLSVRSHIVLGLSDFVGSLGAYAFFWQTISTGLRAEFLRDRLYEKERRDWVAFLLIWTAFGYDTAGRTLGLKCGSRTAASLDSLHLGHGKVPLCQTSQQELSPNNRAHAVPALGENGDLPESNLCSGKSCDRMIAPVRTPL